VKFRRSGNICSAAYSFPESNRTGMAKRNGKLPWVASRQHCKIPERLRLQHTRAMWGVKADLAQNRVTNYPLVTLQASMRLQPERP
jgi:hypothetical protein